MVMSFAGPAVRTQRKALHAINRGIGGGGGISYTILNADGVYPASAAANIYPATVENNNQVISVYIDRIN